MSFDGVFINHLLEEIKPKLIKQRINRIHNLDRNSFIFSLANKRDLLIDLHSDSCHLRFLKTEYLPANQTFPLYTLLKKNLEGGRILSLKQIDNDRIIIFEFAAHDELGFPKKVKLVLELFGRNSNLLLLDEEEIIIDCLKKTYVISEKDGRIILPKVKYELPANQNRTNPYLSDKVLEYNHYQGVSNLLYAEMRFQNDVNIIKNKTEPVLLKTNGKYHFYCFKLQHLNAETTHFPTLSELLEHFYLVIKHQDIINAEQRKLEQRVRKEKAKALEKLRKQEEDYRKAEKNLSLEKTGNLLSANLHLVTKGSSAIEVENFYNFGEKVLVPLDPLLTPAQNLEHIYSKYKKAKRTLVILKEQIKATNTEILYWETLEEQLQNAGTLEIREILAELKTNSPQPKNKKKQKPQLTTYRTETNALIMVGKNNIQNNYLTHTLAQKTDYFFHVKNAPGSHTILRCEELTPELIKLAGMIAAFYSKNRNSENVPVDYTLIKNVKKVPKTKGSFVTYTNYKTVYVTPDADFINKNTI